MVNGCMAKLYTGSKEEGKEERTKGGRKGGRKRTERGDRREKERKGRETEKEETNEVRKIKDRGRGEEGRQERRTERKEGSVKIIRKEEKELIGKERRERKEKRNKEMKTPCLTPYTLLSSSSCSGFDLRSVFFVCTECLSHEHNDHRFKPRVRSEFTKVSRSCSLYKHISGGYIIYNVIYTFLYIIILY